MPTSTNPATGEQIATYDEHTADEVTGFVEEAHARHLEWRRTSFDERAGVLRATADALDARADELAELMAAEMGKPLAAGRSEVEKCAWACRYYADHGAEHLADVPIEADRRRSYIHHDPLGVVLAVMPWNFPLWQVFRFAAPALMAGNAGLLKHASNVTGCALAIEDLFRTGGAPEGLFRTLVISSRHVEAVLEHPLVRAATLTGSVPAGSAVAEAAGRLLKKTVLELGGSDPYVVLADADVEAAAKTCATSRLINSGQSCIAAKRFIVVDEVHDAFVDAFVAEMAAAVMGDPMDDETTVGPQAQESLRDDLHDQVRRTIDAGAELVLGGEVPDRDGAWYPPTVLTGVTSDMAAGSEETFGPVGAVMRARDEDHAIELANDTSFGLGAAVFTQDLERGERIAAEELAAGCCFVNDLVASDPRLPFGGIKDSGYGRELSHLGIREFVNEKTVAVGPKQ
ncbi:MAG TPA: NAD-dependent succinate-semialdehyde dehydrogenase [Acidimicrobiales bacterium]|nr:NAD-dependent succinate-semialdehyde dehydrogenase [Acidimicrobiales bacterium]